MEREKKKVLVGRILFLVVILLAVLVAIFSSAIKPKLVDETVYDDGDIKVKFDRAVYSATITIAYYDSSYKLISVEEVDVFSEDDGYCYGYGFIYSTVDSYEIIDYSCTTETAYCIYMFCLVSGIILLAPAIDRKCKVYIYNGKRILVYAGCINFYIKVKGVKCDETKALFRWSPLYLTCNTGENIEVRISPFFNSTTVKIDGILQKPLSFFEKELKNEGDCGRSDN
ncbi:MAG: hypothetical protein IJV99_03310 [Clostridia bacterium]|nr:hypothetical protein [Clostridia bacterium]